MSAKALNWSAPKWPLMSCSTTQVGAWRAQFQREIVLTEESVASTQPWWTLCELMARYLPTGERLQNKVFQAWCHCHIKLCKMFYSTEGLTSPVLMPENISSVSCTLGKVNKHMEFWWKAAANRSPAKWADEPLLLRRPVWNSSYVLRRIFRYFVA